MHCLDGEWWVQSRETGWQVGGFPSELCAQEVADRIEALVNRLEEIRLQEAR